MGPEGSLSGSSRRERHHANARVVSPKWLLVLGFLLLAALVAAPPASAVTPTVILGSPVGGEDWTGGTVHSVLYTVSNSFTFSVEFWVNMSSNDGVSWTTIHNGTMAPTNTTQVFAWAVPLLNSAFMRIRLCGSDFTSTRCTMSGRFTVDSTHPSASPFPMNGRTGVSVSSAVSVNFTEPMQTTAPPLNAVVFVPAVSVTALTWTSNVTLAVAHAGFAYSTIYTWYVNCTFRDASIPGNSLTVCGSPMWSFSTAAAVPPTVTLTSPMGGAGGADWTGGSVHSIQWSLSDPDSPLVSSWVNASVSNASGWTTLRSGVGPANGSGQSLPWLLPRINSSTAQVRVCASDGLAVTCSTSLPFTIDSTPPGVTPSPVSGAQVVSLSAPVLLRFTEPMGTNGTAVTAVTFTPAVAVLAVSWTTPFDLSVTHADFAPATVYVGSVACSVHDASVPGNPVPGCGGVLWSFRTDALPAAVSLAIGNRSSPSDLLHIPPDEAPVFSWVFTDPDPGAIQAAFEWEVLNGTTSSVLADSGPVLSSSGSALYDGLPLVPGACYRLRLRLNDGTEWGLWGAVDFCVAELILPGPSVSLSTTAVLGGAAAVLAVSAALVLVWPRAYRIPEVLALAEAILALLLDVSLIVPSWAPLRLDPQPGFLVAAALIILPVVVHFLPETPTHPLDPGEAPKGGLDGVASSLLIGLGLSVPLVAPVAFLGSAAAVGLGLSIGGRWRTEKEGGAAPT